MVDKEDLEIIEEVLKGNINLYRKLVEKYSTKLTGYIFNITRDIHLSQDFGQEVFIKAYKNLDKFDKEKSFSVWLLRIGRNTALDHMKKKYIHYELSENLDSNTKDTTLMNPSEILIKKEEVEELEKIIHQLPNKYKDLILLKYFEDLSYKDISLKLDISIDKVKWRLYEARKLCIRELGKNKPIERRDNIGLQPNKISN
ncbi:RNA polymerase sigma factor [Tissierella sp. MSJ-40]|uniref:RNA polymerase sigma factor n=1 Tax=Tissierella simiarum TaxID=2841534 RepID=A0ABS6E7D1_9FIRM|nr:RNA polymerase sigma factor [Tissierella simiarum]MBU5438823.1 RNA polymerase sigma factor [Tissierella simiarum]